MGVPYAEVIGDPIAHSKSPLIHKFWLEKLGLEGDYRATRVTRDELPAYFAARRSDPDWLGCNVTIPHKRAVMQFLDKVEDYGAGAVNLVRPAKEGLLGLNTDTGGISESFKRGVDTGAPICIVGAGGAARAAVAALDVLAVFQFRILARDGAQAGSLLAPYGEYGRWFDFDHADLALKGCEGAINATPLGMTGFPAMPASVLSGLAGIRRSGFALDLVYQPLETDFIAAARCAGLETTDGLTVLLGQALYGFFHFFGKEPPREHDGELRELLTR